MKKALLTLALVALVLIVTRVAMMPARGITHTGTDGGRTTAPEWHDIDYSTASPAWEMSDPDPRPPTPEPYP